MKNAISTIMLCACAFLLRAQQTPCCGPDTCQWPVPCNGDFGNDSLQTIFEVNLRGDHRGEIKVDSNGNKYLVTNTTFNKFVAQKVAYYLSGSSELSLYDNFAIADVTDGSLTVGHNFARKHRNERVSSLLTTALKTNVANDFATIFSDKKFSDETGISLKYTKLFATKTHISYGTSQRQAFDRERWLYYCRLQATMRENRRMCCMIGCDTLVDSARAKYREEQLEKNIADFYDFEIEKINAMSPGHGYNLFFTHWASIQTYIPLTKRTYSIAPDTASPFSDQSFSNWSGALNYGGLVEGIYGTLFYNLSYKVYLNNSIETNDTGIIKYSMATYTPIPSGSTTFLSNDPEDVYVGRYKAFLTHALQAQFIALWPVRSDSKIGLSFLIQKNLGIYDITNITAGIPIFLKGQEKDKGVNVELQARWFDVTQSLPGNLSLKERFSFGLSLALPFGSILY